MLSLTFMLSLTMPDFSQVFLNKRILPFFAYALRLY